MTSLKDHLGELVIDSFILSKQSDYHQGMNDAYTKLYLYLYGYDEKSKILDKAITRLKKSGYKFSGQD